MAAPLIPPSDTFRLDGHSADLIMRSDPEKVMRGEVNLSAECQANHDLSIGQWVEKYPAEFLRKIRTLPREAQDVLLQHYFLSATQLRIAPFYALNQTRISSLLRTMIIRAAGIGLNVEVSRAGLPIARRKDGKYRKMKDSPRFHVYRSDPEILGNFRIDISDPDFAHVFTPTARIVGHLKMDDYLEQKLTSES